MQPQSGGGLSKFTVCTYVLVWVPSFFPPTLPPIEWLLPLYKQQWMKMLDVEQGIDPGYVAGVWSAGIHPTSSHILHAYVYVYVHYVHIRMYVICTYTVELIVGLSLSHLMCSQRCARDVDVF